MNPIRKLDQVRRFGVICLRLFKVKKVIISKFKLEVKTEILVEQDSTAHFKSQLCEKEFAVAFLLQFVLLNPAEETDSIRIICNTLFESYLI